LQAVAKEALKAYLMADGSYVLKDCFDVERLAIAAVAKSFGFRCPLSAVRRKENGRGVDHGREPSSAPS
jgi:hypothetical protein